MHGQAGNKDDLAIVGGTILDGTGRDPISDGVVVISRGRIRSVGPRASVDVPSGTRVVDAKRRWVIPGLLDANVHLMPLIPDYVLLHRGKYEELIIEAAQMALSGGVTTVFDTWGPTDALINARDAIQRGEALGSRMFVAGNIVGFPGLLGSEHAQSGNLLNSQTLASINAEWEKGVGPETWWFTPEQVADRLAAYIDANPVDFIKYAGSAHDTPQINYSDRAQAAIVETAHRAGLPVEAHTMSVESLRMAVEAGVDILIHPNVNGSQLIPQATLDEIARRKIPAAANIWTQRYMDFALEHWSPRRRRYYGPYVVENCKRLIDAGVELILTTDGWNAAPLTRSHPWFLHDVPIARAPDFPYQLGSSHFPWFDAMGEQGVGPMEALVSATQGVARAYRVDADLGTLEPGKIADAVVLDANPLDSPRNYRSIAHVIKDGVEVDFRNLPTRRIASDDFSVGQVPWSGVTVS